MRVQREEDAPFFAYFQSVRKSCFNASFEKPPDEEEVKTCINVDHKSKISLIHD